MFMVMELVDFDLGLLIEHMKQPFSEGQARGESARGESARGESARGESASWEAASRASGGQPAASRTFLH